jgi:glycosyltransferase involved in cell wall biosynthesis
VLNLVTTERARFFRQQIRSLEQRDVTCDTVAVPGNTSTDESRTALDYLRFLPTVLRRSLGSYDLVHANFGLTAPHALVQARLPVVVSLWGTDLYGPYGWVSRLSGRYANAVIVMSEAMADVLDYDCEVIPHGVDIDLFRPMDGTAACREVGWNPDRANVLFPYDEERSVKNYPLAERVVDAARERVDRTVELRTVTGVSHERMPAYMNAADALLLTSRWEGSPNAVKEALACNLPVVSRPVGDVPERLADVEPSVVGRSESGLVDGLVEVLRADTRSNGRTVARELGHDRMGEQIREIYERVT